MAALTSRAYAPFMNKTKVHDGSLTVFPRLALVTCFPALSCCYMLSRTFISRAWHLLPAIASNFDWFIALFMSVVLWPVYV